MSIYLYIGGLLTILLFIELNNSKSGGTKYFRDNDVFSLFYIKVVAQFVCKTIIFAVH